MEEKTVNIPTISCGHCVMTIERQVGELEGVKSVEADANTKKVTNKVSTPRGGGIGLTPRRG
jgi:copper chaperone CopZ